ncbi:hypothetical protein [Streptobacillus canis]|uniref:hypothetical protein n=1 Tax=Streptobacillus canis TaxID=2678686 RepID=UPI0018CC3819|nr:hypothetical protein [Streptobacillus canis]
MRKVKMFIAMSLDGFIADENGSVKFLQSYGENTENEDTYSKFIKEIDTILMG